MTTTQRFGKVRVMITDAPQHIVIFENGKRTRLFPVVVGQLPAYTGDPFAGIPWTPDERF